MKPVSIIFVILALQGSVRSQQADYRLIHDSAIVVDMHNDVVQRMVSGDDISFRLSGGHSDLPRFREGGLDVCFFSIWVPPSSKAGSYFDAANRQIDSVISFVERNKAAVGFARSRNDIEYLNREGKFAVMMGLEGGHPVGNDLKRIDYYYARGVRYMTLTWNNSTDWATSAQDEEEKRLKGRSPGLTPFGRRVVQRMNELGMIIDVSHAGERTVQDVISASSKPVIASHSSVWRICPNRRNLKDEQIAAIAGTGGAIFVNFAPFFIDSAYSQKERELERMRSKDIERIKLLPPALRSADSLASLRMYRERADSIRPPIGLLVDHIEYIANLVGADHVGLGSDFDGIHVTPRGMDDVTYLPAITKELLRRKFSVSDIRKILGGNLLRILGDHEPRERK